MAVTDADIKEILRMLIEGLRREAGINREIRLMIADLLDSNSNHLLQLKLSRRKRGRPAGDQYEHLLAASRVRTLMEQEKMTRQRAIHAVSKQLGISERTVETGLKNYADLQSEQEAFEASHPDRLTAK